MSFEGGVFLWVERFEDFCNGGVLGMRDLMRGLDGRVIGFLRWKWNANCCFRNIWR